jgi:hypothetical protein
MPTVTQFSTVDLLTGMEALVPAEQFLNATFFGRTSFFTGRFAQVDSRKARRFLAPVVKYGQPGRAVSREPIATKFYDVPEVKPVRVTTVTDLDDRLLGESSYSRRTPDERLAEIVAADVVDLTNSVMRRIEQMTSSILFTGSFSYLLDDGSTESLDYGTVTPVVPTAKWDATGDPIADLAAASNAIVAASGLLPDTLVLGADVLSAFLANTKVQDQLNKLHLVTGGIQPSPPQGVGTAQLIGKLFRPYLLLYSYAEVYESETTPGTLVPMVPDDSALLGCSTSPAVTSYGAITQTEQDGTVRSYADVKFVPRRLADAKEDKAELRIASRPCLVPYDLASWAVIKPVTATVLRKDEQEEQPHKRGWDKRQN